MGSSLPTPVLSPRASLAADDGNLSLEDMYSSAEDESPAELHDVPTGSVLEHHEDASDTAISAPGVVKRLKSKEEDVAIAIEKKRPLQLLDLPVDILKEIIKEV